ncbi:HlyD family secretion protein [Parachitinimonas caeni]|uniref:HlyD family efflux transporter periplasmic adaptor subunit n=1 Tax=Parachitinimonas caeni TaxID=3031301 RepID=A0ABT7DV01_9NEIS|nr:HlyD family efflux transporter periplasmic adaptor subunit [Parachitinimonas caeni]MDK2123901.1 HlyD family efflux transporter periplasmic adaptor subunit [Parachitinimonas caeni]
MLGLAGCNDSPPAAWSGYVEIDPVRVAAPAAGRLMQLSVEKGAEVKLGQLLFVLDREAEQAVLDEAGARLRRGEAQAANLESGRRSEELAVITAQQKQAEAALLASESALRRQRKLAEQGFVSAGTLEGLLAQRDRDAAKVNELAQQLKVAQLAAREAERQAARADTDAGRAALAQAKWRLDQRSVLAPLAARVEQSYFKPGEWVPAGVPVLSLQAPAAIKARFYLPEAERPTLKLGDKVQLGCDSCGAPITATVSYLANQAEFTPPVIYNKDNRTRLVYLVEAQPAPADAARLRPGLPLDVRRAGAMP